MRPEEETEKNVKVSDNENAEQPSQPRRSARLMNRRESPLKRGNEETSQESQESGSETESFSRNVRVKRDEGQEINNAGSNASSNAGNNADNSTSPGANTNDTTGSNTTGSNTTTGANDNTGSNTTTGSINNTGSSNTGSSNTGSNDNTSSSNTPDNNLPPNTTNNTSSSRSSPQLPIISFSIGISRTPSVTSPADIQWIFNSTEDGSNANGNTDISEMIRTAMMANSSGSGQGNQSGFTMGMSSFTIPIGISRRSATADNSTTETSPEINNDELLDFARQMFQIITRVRSVSPANTDNNNNNSSTASLNTSDLETLLNDFFTRMFGAAPSTAPAGLNPDRIANLPEFKEKEEIDCSICREIAKCGEEKCVELPCKHRFHFECIEPWLKRVASCPICRKVIE